MRTSSPSDLKSRELETIEPNSIEPEGIDESARGDLLTDAVELAREGQFVDALSKLQSCGSLKQWRGTDRTEVSWIVRELGAPRFAL